MTLSAVKVGDIVLCDVRGDRFYATVTAHRQRSHGTAPLSIESLTGRPIPTRVATARQVVGHWRKSKQSKV